ncbi:protein serine/threonine phosphatase 2C [Mycena alexandri]|uniref:Protein phosphatase n=1 Tax=Mycena alexandri TaxID=1745969 RepID=A0AAD6XE80_9AGAR|nr:protein serine/threonine phosphatase 2C [Mycena alexandri]
MLRLRRECRAVNFKLSSLAGRHYSSIQRPYIFHTAADWEGKPVWDDVPKPKSSFPANSPISAWRDKSLARLSSRSKPHRAGEDFFLCSNMRHNSGVALGVADGVGGWIESGIDSSMFSQALMYYADQRFRNGWAGEPENDPTVKTTSTAIPEGIEMSPSHVMGLAHDALLADTTVDAGSSTACFITLNASSGILQSANLGDSGFCIVRSSAVFYSSPPQTHYFNCPRQLAKVQRIRGSGLSGRALGDSISDFSTSAQTYSTRLRDGDIIIAFTDGVADNIFPAEILKLCTLVMNGSEPEAKKAQLLAKSLVYNSRVCMFNDRVSPFELEARRHRKIYRGGKIDDVTVVVALVREAP